MPAFLRNKVIIQLRAVFYLLPEFIGKEVDVMRLSRILLDGFDKDLTTKDFPSNPVLGDTPEENRWIMAVVRCDRRSRLSLVSTLLSFLRGDRLLKVSCEDDRLALRKINHRRVRLLGLRILRLILILEMLLVEICNVFV